MLVLVLVSVVQVPKVPGTPIALGDRYHYLWYRYHFSTAVPLHFRTSRGLLTASVIDNDDLRLFFGGKPLRNCVRDIEQPAHP